jgi:hypothetical protein
MTYTGHLSLHTNIHYPWRKRKCSLSAFITSNSNDNSKWMRVGANKTNGLNAPDPNVLTESHRITCHPLCHSGKGSNLASFAVFSSIHPLPRLAVPHFTYTVEHRLSRMRGGNRTNSATQKYKLTGGCKQRLYHVILGRKLESLHHH